MSPNELRLPILLRFGADTYLALCALRRQHQHGKVTTEEQHWRFTFARAFFDGISNLLLAIKRGLTLQYPTCAGSSLFQLKHFLYSEPGNDDTAAARTQNHPLCTTSYLLKTKRIDRGPCHSAMSQQATSPALAVAPELTQCRRSMRITMHDRHTP